MNRLMRYSCLLLCLSAGLTACDDDGIDVLDIEIPEGYALSAGTSTIFMNSSKAYDSPADWVSGVYNSRFNDGAVLLQLKNFFHRKTPSPEFPSV